MPEKQKIQIYGPKVEFNDIRNFTPRINNFLGLIFWQHKYNDKNLNLSSLVLFCKNKILCR